ncbi:MAG: hypothetical protein ACXWUG_06860 [Polyangiales bacterium]
MELLRFVHFVGAALFLGAMVGAGIANRVAIHSQGDVKAVDLAVYTLLRFANAGLVFLLASGVGIIAMTGTVLLKLHWMHVMLTCFLGAGAVAGIAQGKARRLTEGDGDASSRRRIATMCIVGMSFAMGGIFAGVFRF